jgi:hypothetical protein
MGTGCKHLIAAEPAPHGLGDSIQIQLRGYASPGCAVHAKASLVRLGVQDQSLPRYQGRVGPDGRGWLTPQEEATPSGPYLAQLEVPGYKTASLHIELPHRSVLLFHLVPKPQTSLSLLEAHPCIEDSYDSSYDYAD